MSGPHLTGKERPWDYVLGLKSTPVTAPAQAQPSPRSRASPRAPRTSQRRGTRPSRGCMGAASRISSRRPARAHGRLRHRVSHRRGRPPHQRASRAPRARCQPRAPHGLGYRHGTCRRRAPRELIHRQEHLQDERGGQPCCVNSRSRSTGPSTW